MDTATLEPASLIAESPLALGLESAGLLLTPEQFDAIEEYDNEYRYELIHGVLVVNGIPAEAEASPNDELGYLLRDYKHRHPQGAALDETLPERYIRLPHSRRRADRVIWAGLGRQPDPRLDLPSVAIEFVSQGKRNWHRDYVVKKVEYHSAGVIEYWVIDRFRRLMTVYFNDPAGPRELVLAEHETYRTPLLPGFELPLARLLRVANAWK